MKKMYGVFYNLPEDVWGVVWEYHDEFRKAFRKHVLPELQQAVGKRMMVEVNALKHDILHHRPFNEHAVREMYDLLMGDSCNIYLLQYDTDFHFIDQVFFNYSIMKQLWRSR